MAKIADFIAEKIGIRPINDNLQQEMSRSTEWRSRAGAMLDNMFGSHRTLLKSIVEIGRTLNIIRDELQLIYNRPVGGATQSAAPEGADPAILRDYISGSRIREVYPTDIFPELEKTWLPVGAVHEESQHFNQVDLLYVAAMAKVLGAKAVFEFGTYQGRTTYHLALASDETRVTTLNLPPEKDESVASFLGVMFKGTDREKQITQVLADSREFDPTPYAGQMDYVFVDGDHSYELVKNDTEKALVMLKPGGTIVWHDFAAKSPGVVRYIAEFAAQRPVFRLKHTCLIVYRDGIDAMAYTLPPRRQSWLSGE